MERANNKNGIEMYWATNGIDRKVDILDSNGNYFEDIYYDDEIEIDGIVKDLENTTLEEMCKCWFCGIRIYNSLRELAENEELTLEETKDNEYLNVFNVNGKTFYTFSW